MFNVKRYREIVEEYDNMSFEDLEDEEWVDRLWREATDLVVESDETFNDFLNYMRTDMTGFEYAYLSSISDEIACEHPSYEFIDEYRMLARKYPAETERYHIKPFIDDANMLVESRIGKRNSPENH